MTQLNKYSSRVTQPKSQGASQAMLYATGLSAEDMNKAQIGIGSVWYDGNSCNMHLGKLADAVKEGVTTLILLLAPMVPHFASEMWNKIGNTSDLEDQSWPKFDQEAAKEDLLTIVIQVNGKVRSRLEVSADITDSEIEKLALADETTIKFIDSKPVKKTIVIKKKLVNIVI